MNFSDKLLVCSFSSTYFLKGWQMIWRHPWVLVVHSKWSLIRQNIDLRSCSVSNTTASVYSATKQTGDVLIQNFSQLLAFFHRDDERWRSVWFHAAQRERESWLRVAEELDVYSLQHLKLIHSLKKPKKVLKKQDCLWFEDAFFDQWMWSKEWRSLPLPIKTTTQRDAAVKYTERLLQKTKANLNSFR